MDVIQAVQQALTNLDRNQINALTHALRRHTGRVFICGNGGGHGGHMAADLRKIARVETYAWGENIHDVTAYTNDLGWAAATTNWLIDSRCGKQDAVLILSVGGANRETSPNLKEAVFWAKNGPQVWGIVGAAGGYTAKHADLCVIIPSFSTPVVEACQAVIWHHIVTELA